MTQTVLIPRTCAGIEIVDARETRIALDDGSLEVRSPGGSRLLDTSELTRAVIVPRDQRPKSLSNWLVSSEVFALFCGDEPRLVIRVADFCPNPGATEQLAREISGVASIAAACHLPLEAASAQERDTIAHAAGNPNVALLLPTRQAPRPTLSVLSVVVAMVLAFVSWPLTFGASKGSELAGLVLGLIALSVGGRSIVEIVTGRMRFFALADSQPVLPTGQVLTPDPASPVLTAGLADARLHVSDSWLVLHDRGTETWVRGRAIAGVVSALVGEDLVRFLDASGHDHLILERSVWAASDEATAGLVAALGSAAIEVTEVRGPIAEVLRGYELLGSATDAVIGARIPMAYQTGGISLVLPWLAWLLSAMVFIGPIGVALVRGSWWAFPFLALSGLSLGALSWASLRLGAWDRRQRRHIEGATRVRA